MKTALIYPPGLHRLFRDQDYHLLLAHLSQHRSYQDLVPELKGYKILDNGAAEGQTIKGRNLVRLATLWEVDELIVPDVLGSYHGTLDAAREFRRHVVDGFTYTGVIQGRVMDEALACANGLALLPYITKIALPRSLCRAHHLDRHFVAESITKWDLPSKFESIHCLGSSSWVREVASLAELPVVTGIDTSMPIKLGLLNQQIQKTREYTVTPTSNDYFDIHRINKIQERCIVNNVSTYREWASSSVSPMRGV